jgi:hypothetical protein
LAAHSAGETKPSSFSRNLSIQRRSNKLAGSPENPEKERRKQRKLKTSFLIG